MITEDYVSFETAKLLKEKGFVDSGDIGCRCGYYSERGHGIKDSSGKEVGLVYDDLNNSELDHDEYLRLTLQMAMKWLRDVHKRIILVNFNRKNRFSYDILLDGECGDNYILYTALYDQFKNYEEACEAGVKYCLKNLI